MKLIRDNIPQIIEVDGKKCHYVECKDKELFNYFLKKKLFEEVNEFIVNPSTEELIDILSVCIGIQLEQKVLAKPEDVEDYFEEIKEAYYKKLNEKGFFDKGYLLITEEDLK